MIRREASNGIVPRRFHDKAIDNRGQLKRGSNRTVNPTQDHSAAHLSDAAGCRLQSHQPSARNVIDGLEIQDQAAVACGQCFTDRPRQLAGRFLGDAAMQRQDRDALGTAHGHTKRPAQNLSRHKDLRIYHRPHSS
jgi:hypothetical protein